MSRRATFRSQILHSRTTADACLRTLRPGQLNVFDPQALLDSSYSVTRTTPQQRELLKALGLSSLARDREIAKRILPRVRGKVADESAVPV